MSINVSEIWALVVAHKWIPLAAIVIGLVVRLLKSDTKIPITIPPAWRSRIALLLGVAAGVLERVANSGTSWGQAIFEGLVAAMLAITGHNVLIDSLRGGREFVIPGLIIPGAAPSPGKPPSIPPGKPPTPPVLPILMLFVAWLGVLSFSDRVSVSPGIVGCNTRQVLTVLDILADKIKCAVENQDLPDEAILAKCAVQPNDAQRVLTVVGESRASARKAVARAQTSDAGAIDGGR